MKKEIIIGLLFCAIAFASESVGVYAQGTNSDGIFSYRVGEFEVYMLVESESNGNTSIIPGADAATLSRYIPAGGFKHSTNAFLIKTPGRIVLVDTGFGRTIFDKMKSLGVAPGDVDAVLITHLHGDHIGGLQSNGSAVFTKAKVYLSAREYEYFTKTQVNRAAIAALAPYDTNVVTFEPGELGSTLRELLPGISPIAAYGHTPGHTAFLVESGGSRLIIAGDFLHVALVQFPNPDISATYDMDQRAAAAVRRQLMDYAVKQGIPLGGMHMVYPGVGTVEADGGGYRFTPAR
jgi:glyoxylase-like metal-dependent hydrolase (beta-lactamase superfamily II)